MSRRAAVGAPPVRVWARVTETWRDERHRVDVKAGGAVWLLLRDYQTRRKAGQVEMLTRPAWHGRTRYRRAVDPAGALVPVPARPELRLRVRFVGPFVLDGRAMREGDVGYMSVGTYRRYHQIGSFQREYERATFRGRPYLRAVAGGGIGRGCGCGGRKRAS